MGRSFFLPKGKVDAILNEKDSFYLLTIHTSWLIDNTQSFLLWRRKNWGTLAWIYKPVSPAFRALWQKDLKATAIPGHTMGLWRERVYSCVTAFLIQTKPHLRGPKAKGMTWPHSCLRLGWFCNSWPLTREQLRKKALTTVSLLQKTAWSHVIPS